jgi:hypothetical protein
VHPKTTTTSSSSGRADTGNANKKHFTKKRFFQKLLGRFSSYFGDLISHAYSL